MFIASHVLKSLTGTCVISKDMGKGNIDPEDESVDVTVLSRTFLGVGKADIWRGSPDALCDDVTIVTPKSGADQDAADSDASGGRKTPVEGKNITFCPADLHQVVGQAVVTSFVHNSRHPNQLPLTPSVGIASGNIIAALYDCMKDVLITLHPPVEWFSIANERCNPVGIVVLWALLHHSLLLNKVYLQIPEIYKSSLLMQFENGGVLQRFRTLNSYHIASWPFMNYPVLATVDWSPESSDVESDNDPPPSKKTNF